MTDAKNIKAVLTGSCLESLGQAIRSGLSDVPDEVALARHAVPFLEFMAAADTYLRKIEGNGTARWIEVPCAEPLGLRITFTLFAEAVDPISIEMYDDHNRLCMASVAPDHTDPAPAACSELPGCVDGQHSESCEASL